MKNVLVIAGLIVATSIAAPLANAGEFQASGGVEYLFDSADADFAFTMATARGAYYFNETWGVEGEASFGLDGADNFGGSGLDFELKNQFGLYGIGKFPVGAKGEFFGRIGFRAGTIDATFRSASEEFDYNGVSLGGGYTYYFNENIGLRGEITTSGAALDSNFDPDGNLTSAGLSLAVKFGQ